jgi:NADH dehydrogenase [ubiquinone] 1 alpha subcomplex assembly factor 1
MNSAKFSENLHPNGFMLYDFSKIDQLNDWLIVNDGVMGGLSTSTFAIGDRNTAVFEGHLTTENNGGFASTRTKPKAFGLAEYSGIRMRILGDGKIYQFRIHTSRQFDGVAYRALFQTEANEWQIIEIPFEVCLPVFRGRILREMPPIDPQNIQQLGFLLAEKQIGDFRLEVAWIEAYR